MKRSHKVLLYFVLFAGTAGAAVLGCYLYRLGLVRMIQTVSLTVFGTSVSVFTREYLKEEKNVAFVLSFVGAAFASVFFPSIPMSVWPFMPLFALLTVLSSFYVGMASAITCLMLSVLLTGNAGVTVFFAYMMAGLVSSLVVSGLTEEFRVTGRILVAVTSLGFMLIWCFILPAGDDMLTQYVMPALNVVFSLIILVIILKSYSQRVVRKYADIYTALADSECELLKRIRRESENEYRHALNVSYFCDRAARCTGVYLPLAKCVSFYHRAGVIYGKNNAENMERVANEYLFPPDLKGVLLDYEKDKSAVRSKCACILMLSDTVVSLLEYMISQGEYKDSEFPKIVRGAIESKLKKTALSDSDLTYHELNEIKRVFLAEAHYVEIMKS